METEIIAELEQVYEWILFIKDNILPIVLSSLAAIIAAIGGVSAMLSNVRSKVKKEAITTELLNTGTKEMVAKFANEYRVVDNRIKELLNQWDAMEAKFNELQDFHKQVDEIKRAVKVIATEDKKFVKSGKAAEVVEILGE